MGDETFRYLIYNKSICSFPKLYLFFVSKSAVSVSLFSFLIFKLRNYSFVINIKGFFLHRICLFCDE